MRITSQAMVQNSVRRLSTRLAAYDRAQTRLATGKHILKPSDDPAGANRALGLRAARAAHVQAQRNASDAMAWLDVADSQMQAAVDRLQRARDLATAAASHIGDAERNAIAEEIDTILHELLGIANHEHRGRPVFAGHGDGPAVVDDGGVWRYAGDDGDVVRRVGDQDRVKVNVTAAELFGVDAAGSGGDVFTMLEEMAAQLRTPGSDGSVFAAKIAEIDTALERIVDQQAFIGAQTNWVESALQRSEDTLLSLRGELAEVEDTEYAAGIMELQTQELAYTATLQALAKALPPSLLSFLR
ncbi:MAG TPA: hypothetical protein VIK95_06830 [Egibacteraceae bacterium]